MPFEVLVAFQKAIDSEPRKPAAHHNLGLALAGGGWSDDPVKHFRQAVALEPTYTDSQKLFLAPG